MKTKYSISTCLALAALGMSAMASVPETVTLDSTARTSSGATPLTGYLYLPDAKRWPGARPAIVLLHGRSGVFSSGAKSYDVHHLSSRTQQWGQFWADRGYIGLYVDSFSTRGYATGFAAGTNDGSRPKEVNEITVRPLDARQGLEFLSRRKDVQANAIFLQGWSNGGSATLASMVQDNVPATGPRFRAAIAVYPACTQVAKHFGTPYQSSAPLLLLIGSEDEEVSYRNCEKLAQSGKNVAFVGYSGASHGYDFPTAKRQGIAANATATEDTMRRVEAFLARFAPERQAK